MSPDTARPPAASPLIKERMKRTRRRDTKAEIEIRRRVHAMGLRYFVDRRLPGSRRRADMLFPSKRVAVFVDGCFWHMCPAHATFPKHNASWWKAKLTANRARDRDTDRRLRAQGWVVLRFWEHESPATAATRVAEAVRGR